MNAGDITHALKERFGEPLLASRLPEAARFLRDHDDTKFDYLRAIAAVDYGTEFELVYLLFSYVHRHEFNLKVRVSRDNPVVPTVEKVWPAANWHEREAYDLMGIHIEGHSDLRRIMLPDDWIGHPLRRDYKEEKEYHGVETTREYTTGMPELPMVPSAPPPKEVK